MYTVGRLVEDTRKIASEATGQYFLDIALQAAEETLADFYSRDWPFTSNEGAITTIAPYATGTIAFTNGSATGTGTGTTWNTAWPTPAIIRPSGGQGEAFLVTAFGSTTGLTIDRPWPFDSASAQTYTIEFPSYPISEYIRVQMVCAAGSQWAFPAMMSSPEEILYKRPWGTWTTYPYEFYVLAGDGTTSASLVLYPAPSQVQTIRFRYTKAVPTFRCLVGSGDKVTNGGVASIAAAGTALTGSNTSWLKLGYSLIGHYFEHGDQDGVYSLISAVASDTAATAAAWGGRAVVGGNYYISPQILMPDDFRPMLRDLMRWKYFQNDVEAPRVLVQESYLRFDRNYKLAMKRVNRMRGPGDVRPIDLGGDYQNTIPGRPWTLQLAYSP